MKKSIFRLGIEVVKLLAIVSVIVLGLAGLAKYLVL